MEQAKTSSFVGGIWDETIVPTLQEYILIPNKSPLFDPDWEKNGHMEKAVKLISGWCESQPIEGLKVEVVRLQRPQAMEPDHRGAGRIRGLDLDAGKVIGAHDGALETSTC